ncbi:hypothetical protein E3Q10_03722 [Wallemia mellicola]|uniref:assimilatory sulfite reductase (NADPH) n=1 Tax=Wallemia mellicola TaxID=1708541 RepID=A0A4T0PFF6_9BASI|nr:hypothetical protein E3Q15_03694 [Wallemia mellicola]TIC25573.1 hypothetical protein E3Q10_03722 [Wallemia mellicola]
MPGSLNPPISSEGPSAIAQPISQQRDKFEKMPSIVDSGIGTPISSEQSLSPQNSNKAGQSILKSALNAVEYNVSANSNSIFLYDSARYDGFGQDLSDDRVQLMQDRPGSGAAVSGYSRASQVATISVLINSQSLKNFIPTLKTYKEKSKLVLQVNTYERDSELNLKSGFTSILDAANQLENYTILLSATAQDIVNNSQLAYEIPGNVIHAFDGIYAAREKSALDQVKPPSTAVTFHSASPVTKALVVPASDISNALLSSLDSSYGLVVIHKLRPLSMKALSDSIPSSIENLLVYNEEKAQGVLLNDVVSAVFNAQRKIKVNAFSDITPFLSSQEATSKSCVFVEQPDQVSADLVGLLFSQNKQLSTKIQTAYDHFIGQTGLALSHIKIGKEVQESALTLPTESSVDFLNVNISSLKATNVFEYVKKGGIVLLDGPLQSPEEVPAKLPYADKKTIIEKGIRVWAVDSAAISEEHQSVATLIAFLLLFTSSVPRLPESIKSLVRAFLPDVTNLDSIIENTEESLYEAIVDESSWLALQPGKEIKPDNRLVGISFNGLSQTAVGTKEEQLNDKVKAIKGSWVEPAWQLLFNESFTTGEDVYERPLATLKPSLPEDTYLVTVKETRRLTPDDYDRNVFHISFDTNGTDLKYEIGEALGVYGHNDINEVKDFLSWYGLPENGVINVQHDNGKVETRSVLQVFQQDIDIFGKPPKSFLASLEEYATSREEQRALRFISSAEGSSTFKKLSEIDTLTYADVLRKFPTAKPPVEELIHLIGEIHPRHYSIASANAVVGNQVDLLIVTVEWATPSGSPRYGQCTRYLAGLEVGTKVAVSIKPSVMKLPERDDAPIIMAGLGTGAAPFRAFIQYRAWQREQGIDVGPLVYYFGSRYRSAEYLYGEELEAYLSAGVLTHMGLAFSRDGKGKVYIQHKMMEDKKILHKMLSRKSEGGDEGSFFLCGPTWPVPDVYEALCGSYIEAGGKTREDAENSIEDMKEDERYVLEVY